MSSLRKIRDAEVSAIGFGAMGLSGFYGEAVTSDEERFKASVSSKIEQSPLIFPSTGFGRGFCEWMHLLGYS